MTFGLVDVNKEKVKGFYNDCKYLAHHKKTMVEIVIFETLLQLGNCVPELRNDILELFPQYNRDIMPLSEGWDDLTQQEVDK